MHDTVVPRERTPRLVWLLLLWLMVDKAGPIIDSDVWWHIATGDLIRASGIPTADPFSWTANGAPWQPNAWLTDVFMSFVDDSTGTRAIALFRAFSVPLLGSVIYRWARHHEASVGASVTAAVVCTVAAAPFIVERPAVLSMLLIAPALRISSRLPNTISGYLPIALVFALWANLHGSAVAGVAVVWAAAAGHFAVTRSAARFGPAIVAALAALLNPYGLSVYTHALTIRSASTTIDEWQPLSLTDSRGQIYVAILAVAVAVMTVRKRRIDLPLILPTLGLAIGMIFTIRTAALFLVVVAPFIAMAAEPVLARLQTDRFGSRPHPALIALVIGSLFVAWSNRTDLLTDSGRIAPEYSQALVEQIPSDCTLFNDYTLGGFVIYASDGEIPVSQDGRNDMYGAELIDEQTELVLRGTPDGLDAFGATCAYLPTDRPLAGLLAEDQAWDEAAGDDHAAVWVRK